MHPCTALGASLYDKAVLASTLPIVPVVFVDNRKWPVHGLPFAARGAQQQSCTTSANSPCCSCSLRKVRKGSSSDLTGGFDLVRIGIYAVWRQAGWPGHLL